MANEFEVEKIRDAMKIWDDCEAHIDRLEQFIQKVQAVEEGRLQFFQVGFSCGIDIPAELQTKIIERAVDAAMHAISRSKQLMSQLHVPSSPPDSIVGPPNPPKGDHPREFA